MQKLFAVTLSLSFAAGLSGLAIAGSMDSPGLPSGGSGLYSLSQIYDYLNSGTEATIPESFQEPGAAPGPTMKTTKQIYDDIKTKFSQCTATAENVELGKTFFSTQSGSWGVQTGKTICVGTPTPTPTVTPTPTLTPTITPTPWCDAKGGHWAADGLGGNGCWFQGDVGQSCNEACSVKELVCDTRQWNSDTSCTICKHWHPAGNCTVEEDSPSAPRWYGPGNVCQVRISGHSTDCDATHPACNRLCVCEQ
ncbi:MAG: hypothetical protein NTZ78_07750 [Candidatus Aureabacteria bacterium]|nr:hypothetical protein [Candidatus Auribacterota bacterium]